MHTVKNNDNIYVKSKNVGKRVNIRWHTGCHLSLKSMLQEVKELKIGQFMLCVCFCCAVEEMIFNLIWNHKIYQRMQNEEMTIWGLWKQYYWEFRFDVDFV